MVRMASLEVLSPEGEVREMERTLGIEVQSSMVNPMTPSPTRISAV